MCLYRQLFKKNKYEYIYRERPEFGITSGILLGNQILSNPGSVESRSQLFLGAQGRENRVSVYSVADQDPDPIYVLLVFGSGL